MFSDSRDFLSLFVEGRSGAGLIELMSVISWISADFSVDSEILAHFSAIGKFYRSYLSVK